MRSLGTIGEWLVILLPLAGILLVILGIAGVIEVPFGFGFPNAAKDSPGGGNLTQEPLVSPEVFNLTIADWHYTLTAKHRYTIQAKVVAIRAYSDSGFEQIVPVDFAVAYGDVLKPEYFPYFSFAIKDRKLLTTVTYPEYVRMLPDDYWFSHTSNNHLVFASPEIRQAAGTVAVGDCITAQGYLVDISGYNDPSIVYNLKTSTSRFDEYPGGCEVVLVESLQKSSC
jgi:hypothetical protein